MRGKIIGHLSLGFLGDQRRMERYEMIGEGLVLNRFRSLEKFRLHMTRSPQVRILILSKKVGYLF